MDRERTSLYQFCTMAVNVALEESLLSGNAFVIDDAVKKVKEITTKGEYSKDWLFERLIRSYISVYANQLNMASGIKGQGVYFKRDIMNEGVSMQLVINAQDDARSRVENASQLLDSHNKRFVKGGMSGQNAFDFDDDTLTLYEEATIQDLIDIMKAEGE